jgi:serine protease
MMAAALVFTGLPLVAPLWPTGPLPVLPLAADDPAPVPGKVVVDARDTLSATEIQRLGARLGINLAYNSAHSGPARLLVADVPVGQEDTFVARLRKEKGIEAADRLHRVRAVWTPNDPRFKEQWNFRMVGAEKAWDRTAGQGVTVAVIDTGVSLGLKDFKGTASTEGYDFVNDDDVAEDDHGHGTHVAGTIAETTDNGEGVAGLAHKAKVMPLKVLDSFGTGTTADIADAIRFAADHGAQVINMSLGGPFPNEAMQNACRYAAKKGVLIVCAAGNSSGGPVGYPAAFPECLAVSAVGPTGELAPYSSVGRQVAIAAPGGYTQRGERPADGVLQNTLQPNTEGELEEGYYAFNGTSMASPHVAASAALVISRGVKDAAEVRQILQRAATRRGPAEKYGAGLLNAARAVDLAGAAHRDSLLLLVFTVIAGIAGVGVGVIRAAVTGLARFPSAVFGLAVGSLGPDLVFGWLGYASPFNLILHSALIPLYLLWEAESKAVYRFVAAVGLGMGLHLAWDALRGSTPVARGLPDHALPWLWVNAVVAIGVALVAYRRGESLP